MVIDSHCSRLSMTFYLGIVLLLLLLIPLPVHSVEPPPPVRVDAGMVSQPLPAWGLNWTKIGGAVGSRRRMLQFATIGMCIGLYILMRK